MRKLFTLTLALLASFSLWANQTDLVDGVTLPDLPSASLDLTTQETFTPDGNGWIVFDPYADAANLSTIPTWWKHTSKSTQGQEVTAAAIENMTAPFTAKTSNNFKVNYSGDISGAIRFTGATKASFLVCSRSSKVFYVGLYSVSGATQTLIEEKSATGSDYNEILYPSLSASTEYVAYFYGKVKQNQCIAEIALLGPAPIAECPSGLSISGTKAYTEGEKIELTAALEEGNGNITYQWYKGSVAPANAISGATNAKYEVASCTTANAGDYFCVASKDGCDDASNAEAYAVTVKTIDPTGDATITYALSGSTVTGTATGVNSISSLSTSLTLSTLTLSGTKDGYSGAIKGCDASTEVNEDIYVDLQFTVANGYAFTPSAVSVKANPFSATGALKAVVKVMDATNTVASNELSCAKNTDNEAVFADGAFTGKLFEGTIHIRMYFYGAASDKAFYLKSPITVEGTVSVAPTKYNVNFAAGEGSGAMSTLKYVAGAEVTLPECTFTAPDGKEFDAWTSSDVTISDNKFTMPAEDVTITATWKTAITRYTVTYKDDETTLGTEEVEENGTPANYATYQTLNDGNLSTFGGWYSKSDLSGDAVTIASATITKDTTFYASFTYKYATSVNMENFAKNNAKGETNSEALISSLGTHKYASNISYVSGTNEIDSLRADKITGDRNYPYLGLKVKTSGALINFRLEEGKTVKVKFGHVGATPLVSINGGEYAAMTITNSVYTYTATVEGELVSIKTASAAAVVFQQIAIDEELANPELFAVTCADAENGTVTSNRQLGIPGETVTLTLAPADGYKVASVTVNGGDPLAVSENTATFTMPAADANVVATFSVATAIDNTADEIKAVKFVENGQLFIRRGEKVYTITGEEVK